MAKSRVLSSVVQLRNLPGSGLLGLGMTLIFICSSFSFCCFSSLHAVPRSLDCVEIDARTSFRLSVNATVSKTKAKCYSWHKLLWFVFAPSGITDEINDNTLANEALAMCISLATGPENCELLLQNSACTPSLTRKMWKVKLAQWCTGLKVDGLQELNQDIKTGSPECYHQTDWTITPLILVERYNKVHRIIIVLCLLI